MHYISDALLGALIVGLAFLASQLGGLVQAGYTVVGVMAGPVLGVYILGIMIPISNRIGAFSGLLAGWVRIYSGIFNFHFHVHCLHCQLWKSNVLYLWRNCTYYISEIFGGRLPLLDIYYH